MCNIWQGTFPTQNTLEDGFLGTAPAGSYPPNGFGISDVAGNTWDWVGDWFTPTFPKAAHETDPTGPSTGKAKVIRGGSYLCHDSYCNRYRVAARTSNEPNSSTGNMGFRCARDA
jgi:formylglycine-generating enzyme required for sulfatase activity